MINTNPVIYPFPCESPTKPETKGMVGKFAISPASYKFKRRKGISVIYAITVTTPKKDRQPLAPANRKITDLTLEDFDKAESLSDIVKVIGERQTKLPLDAKRAYVGLTRQKPSTRLRSHGRSAKKQSQLLVHDEMRKGARQGKEVKGTVVLSVPTEKSGVAEEALMRYYAAKKENIPLNMRKGGAGGGGHKLPKTPVKSLSSGAFRV